MNERIQILSAFKDFCDYSIAFKGNTPKTIIWFKKSIKPFFIENNAIFIDEVDQSKIENWIIKKKIENKWSEKTIKGVLQAFSLFFKWCVEKNYLSENPVAKIPKPKLPKRIPEHLSKENAEKILDWTANYPFNYAFEKARALAILATFLFTGVRLSELYNLRVNDVDVANKVVFVKSGKGRKDRMIPMSTKLIPIY